VVNIKKDNVVMTVDDKKAQYYLDRGYQICGAGVTTPDKGSTPAADLPSMTVSELRKLAKSRGIEGADALRKGELLELLEG
jgi:hypothetical protein